MKTMNRQAQGLTLVEVLLTILIVAIAALAIISALGTGVYFEQSIREENGAIRVAADLMEGTKRELFRDLEQVTVDPVTIDDRGTPDAADDVVGRAEVRFFLEDGTEVGIPGGTPMPEDRSMVRVQATVQWTPAGRRSAAQQEVTIASLLAP